MARRVEGTGIVEVNPYDLPFSSFVEFTGKDEVHQLVRRGEESDRTIIPQKRGVPFFVE